MKIKADTKDVFVLFHLSRKIENRNTHKGPGVGEEDMRINTKWA